MTYKVLTEYNISNSNVFESLFVEICIPNNKNILIGVIYRPPNGNPEEFLDKFSESLSSLTRANKHCYLTGDFNLDLLKHETHSITAQFVEVIMYLLTEWEGRTGKYLARGHGVRTERSEVRAP